MFLHNKFAVAFCSVAETILICGVLFGWPNLGKIFQKENFFIGLCNEEAGEGGLNVTTQAVPKIESCKESADALMKSYTTACTIFSVFALLVGLIYDRFGTMVTRMMGTVMFAAGNIAIVMAYTEDHSRDGWLYPGLSLMASSGIFFLTCQMQTANLFTDGAGRVLTMINGSMDTSSGTALILVALHSAFGYKMCWTIYGALAVPILLRTLFLLPKTTIPQPLPDNYKMDTPIGGSEPASLDVNDNDTLLDEKTESQKKPDIPPFFSDQVLLSPLYWSTVVFFVLNVWKVYYFIGSMRFSTAETIQAVNNVTQEEAMEEADTMASNFGAVQLLGVFIAPINGFIIDNMMRVTKGAKYRSLAVSMLCLVILGTLFSFISTLPYVKLQYLAYILSTVHRGFTYGGNAAVIAMCFPIEYFGKLYGISQFATLISGWLTGQGFNWAFGSSFKKMNWVMMVLQIATLWHVLVLMIYSRKKDKQETAIEENKKLTSRSEG